MFTDPALPAIQRNAPGPIRPLGLAAPLWVLCIALLLRPALLGAQPLAPEETVLTGRTETVKVYLNRAELTFIGRASLSPGKHLLVFTDLSPSLQPNTIIVKGDGDGVIQSVSHRVNFGKNTPQPKRMTTIQDSLKLLDANSKQLDNALSVLAEEEKVLLKHNQLGAEAVGWTVADLQGLLTLYRERLTTIRAEQTKHTTQKSEINETKKRLHDELKSMNAAREQQVMEVVVAYEAKKAGPVTLGLTYQSANATWMPKYDLRVAAPGKPVELLLKAEIVNKTGIDWKNVQVSLSSANPLQHTVAPNLNPWYLQIFQPIAYGGAQLKSSAPRAEAYGEGASYDVVVESAAPAPPPAPKPAATASDYTTVSTTALSVEYAIAMTQTIPADGKPHLTDVQRHNLPASFRYLTIPKQDLSAYLQASLSGWEKLDLLAGPATIYLEGTFIGSTTLDPSTTTDTLHIGLGRDPRVVTKRTKLQDLGTEKFIGTKRVVTRGYEIEVRNTRQEAITLVIEDQIPITFQTKDIEITLLKAEGAEYDDKTGKLIWRLTLAPAETRRITFTFEVKHAKNVNISGL
jgi:uncharacterized protein (TIGR02231 family)